MSIFNIVKKVNVKRTPRVMQLEGIFEMPPTSESENVWRVDMPLDENPWQIGLIVGPSGSGKTTVAKEVFGDSIIERQAWSSDASIVDDFPEDMSIKSITSALSSVGFSSPPSWLRPYDQLSNGEQFRVMVARALSENTGTVVIDEFTSVVDRTVAQIGSAAVSKAIRRTNKKFVAVSCHYDIEDWLQPDWIYQPHVNQFIWRSVQPRPQIQIEIQRIDKAAWLLFKKHHYLNTSLNKAAKCFMASINENPVAFTAVLPFPSVKSGWREHRTVCLPDYQGVGIGNALSNYVASIFTGTGKPYYSNTSNPAMIAHRARSKKWKMTRGMGLGRLHTDKNIGLNKAASTKRLTASFKYVGEPCSDYKKFYSPDIKSP